MKVITPPVALALALAALPLVYFFLRPSRRRARPTPTAVDLSDDELVKRGFSKQRVPTNVDVIVIGSGIGGLSAASALAQEGKRVLVLEQHDVAGGNTHTFEEHGYEFDTGLHYIGGGLDDKRRPTRRIFDFLSNHGIEFSRLGDTVDVVAVGDETFDIPASHEAFKTALKAKFPDEHAAIDSFFGLVRRAGASFMHVMYLQVLPVYLRGLYAWWFRKEMEPLVVKTCDVIDKLTSNPVLKGIFTYSWGDFGEPPSRSSFALTAALTNHYRGGAYYPVGGPSVIAKKMARVITSLGGQVLVRAPVDSILVSPDGAAMGVMVKGTEIYAPIVVSSVGAPITYLRLVPEAHRVGRVKALADAFTSNPALHSPCSLMSLFIGFEADAVDLPLHNVWKYPSWDFEQAFADNKANPHAPFCAQFMSFPSAKDPTYAERHPKKHVALVIAGSFYDHVEPYKDGRVKRRGPEYEALKASWTTRLLESFHETFPQVPRGAVTFTELGTALTNDYYLGNYRGAIYGMAHTPARFQSDLTDIRTPIQNLYLTGQDVVSCGIIGAMFGGLTTAAVVSPGFFTRLGNIMKGTDPSVAA